MSDQAFDYRALLGEDDESVLDSLMAERQPDEAPPKEEQRREPEKQKKPSGGYQIQIARLRKEIEELESRLLNHREKGTYITKDNDGRSMFDHLAYQEDQVLLGQKKRQLDDVRDAARESQTISEAQSQKIARWAGAYLKREVGSYPEHMRKRLQELFTQQFRQLKDQGTWSNPMYGEMEKAVSAFDSIMSNVVGFIAREEYRKPKGDRKPAPSGFDEDDDTLDAKPDDDEDGDDEFTKGVMEAYARRSGKSMSVAEYRRLEREKAAEKAKKGAEA